MSVRHNEECALFMRGAQCDCGAQYRAVKQLWPAWNDLPQPARADALKVAEERRVSPMTAVTIYEALRASMCRSAGVPITAADNLPRSTLTAAE